MYELMRRSTVDRLVDRVVRLMFDPAHVDPSPDPLVFDDGPYYRELWTGLLDSEVGDDRPFLTCFFFYCLLTDEAEDVEFWEQVAAGYLEGRVSTYLNLIEQADADETLDPEAMFLAVDRLVAERDLDPLDRPYRDLYYYLSRLSRDTIYKWMLAEPEYVWDLYAAFYGQVLDQLEHTVRMTILVDNTPTPDKVPRFLRATLYSSPYDVVARVADEYLRGTTIEAFKEDFPDRPFPDPPRYLNPYKGGGFSCSN